MRVTVLTTRTNNCPVLFEPLRKLDHEVSLIVYDLIAKDMVEHLPHVVEMNNPDWVLMIGAVESYHPGVPPVPILAKIAAKYRLVHLCCDGAEPVWWEQLQRYYDGVKFALQVNIDGVRTGPIGEHGLTLLAPLDSSDCPSPSPIKDRIRGLGFAGSEGFPRQRTDFLARMKQKGLVICRPRDNSPQNTGYMEFLGSCKGVWNGSWTGSGERTHVKARVLEAAVAGAVLFESANSPTQEWFKPGVDYFPYESIADVQKGVDWLRDRPDEAQEMADNLRRRVMNEYSPRIFWGHVLDRIGLYSGPKLPVIPTLELKPWKASPPPPPVKVSTPAAHPSGPTPVLLKSRNGFNLVAYNGYFMAVPQSLGTLDLTMEAHRRRPGIVTFSSVEEAEKLCPYFRS